MSHPPVCDYEGSDYRTRFWEQQGREYEDQVERIALGRLMPLQGEWLIDIGAGFGRLATEYGGYQRVILFDYSRSLLAEARERLGADPRFLFVRGDWYRMPFVVGLFDTLVQVRTIHHAADVPALFGQLARIAGPGAHYILEFANKKNLKAILRYWGGQQRWSPFDLKPVEFVELNFDFHPRWIRRQLIAAGFEPGRMLSVSHFRLPLIKRLVPTRLLVGVDSLLQYSGDRWQLSPSIFVSSRRPTGSPSAAPGAIFACPICATPLGEPVNDLLICPKESCGRRWQFREGIYDFESPVIAD